MVREDGKSEKMGYCSKCGRLFPCAGAKRERFGAKNFQPFAGQNKCEWVPIMWNVGRGWNEIVVRWLDFDGVGAVRVCVVCEREVLGERGWTQLCCSVR